MRRRGRPALTPWFPGDVRPARPGVYQRRVVWGVAYAKWDGQRWFQFCEDLDRAALELLVSDVQNGWPWRGRRHSAS